LDYGRGAAPQPLPAAIPSGGRDGFASDVRSVDCVTRPSGDPRMLCHQRESANQDGSTSFDHPAHQRSAPRM